MNYENKTQKFNIWRKLLISQGLKIIYSSDISCESSMSQSMY